MNVLDTTRAATTDALAEAWHAVGIADGDHPLRACHPRHQADVWSDVAQWVTFLAGGALPLSEGGIPLLAEAMHGDCFTRDDHAPHPLWDCPSAALRTAMPRDASQVLAWLSANPSRNGLLDDGSHEPARAGVDQA